MEKTTNSIQAFVGIIKGTSFVKILFIDTDNNIFFFHQFDANYSTTHNNPTFFDCIIHDSQGLDKSEMGEAKICSYHIQNSELIKIAIVLKFYGVFLVLNLSEITMGKYFTQIDMAVDKQEAIDLSSSLFEQSVTYIDPISRICKDNIIGDNIIHVSRGIVIKNGILYTCSTLAFEEPGTKKDDNIRDIWIPSIKGKGPVRPLNMSTISLNVGGSNMPELLDLILNPGGYVIK